MVRRMITRMVVSCLASLALLSGEAGAGIVAKVTEVHPSNETSKGTLWYSVEGTSTTSNTIEVYIKFLYNDPNPPNSGKEWVELGGTRLSLTSLSTPPFPYPYTYNSIQLNYVPSDTALNDYKAVVEVVPEPSPLALLGVGAAIVSVCAWRRTGGVAPQLILSLSQGLISAEIGRFVRWLKCF